MSASFLIFLLSLVGSCLSEPTWQTLRVRWSINPLSSSAFAKLPVKSSNAKDYGFKRTEGSCSGGKFVGYRYEYPNKDDPAVVLIYDSQGYIAGIQSGILKEAADNLSTTYPFSSTPAFQLLHGIYFRTAYFLDPSTICQSNRTSSEFEENIGRGLWIQNGSDPIRDSAMVPLYETGLGTTEWTKGKCFISMGKHYWYNAKEDMDCKQFFPFFLMYNRGKLTGFGFATVGKFESSNRFEYPSKDSFSKFFDPVPRCLKEEYDRAGGFTTMHVYFTVRPWNLLC